jgi:hypothetical protein
MPMGQPGTLGDAIDAGRGSSYSSSLARLVDDDADGFAVSKGASR